MTDAWDPSIPEHIKLQHELEFGNGIPEMRPIKKAREALISVGFRIEHEEDLAERGDEVPWYYPLEGDISKAQTTWDYFTVWRMSWSVKLVTHNVIWAMEYLRLIPKGTVDVGEALKVASKCLVKGGRTKVRLFGCWLIMFNIDENHLIAVHADVLCRKPQAHLRDCFEYKKSGTYYLVDIMCTTQHCLVCQEILSVPSENSEQPFCS